MTRDWGWVELREPLTERSVARAHVHADELREGGWRGALDSVHLAAGQAQLQAGAYFAQFGSERGTHLVHVEAAGDGLTIHGEGPGLPAVVSELNEGE
jgi:hypothetical protein